MKLIQIFLITFIIILLAACGSESTPSSVVKDETSTPIRGDNQTAKSQVNNWREIYRNF